MYVTMEFINFTNGQYDNMPVAAAWFEMRTGSHVHSGRC